MSTAHFSSVPTTVRAVESSGRATAPQPALSVSRTSIREDRKSTRLNSSHVAISYAVFCLKKKNNHQLPLLHPDKRGRQRPGQHPPDPSLILQHRTTRYGNLHLARAHPYSHHARPPVVGAH